MLCNVRLDFCNTKGYSAYCITYKGRLVRTETIRSVSESQNENLIHILNRGIHSLKEILENTKIEGSVLVVSSNRALISWLSRGYGLEKYESFNSVQDLVQKLPYKINYIYNNNLLSYLYAKEEYVQKERMYTVDEIFS